MKRALVVGIDDYQDSPLTGCVADADAISLLLKHHEDGTRNYDVRKVTSKARPIDRQRLRTLLRELFDNARGTELLFYFAGHGAQTPWGAELVAQNYSENSLGVSMNDLITLANESPAPEVVLILDCCFSGDLGNLPGLAPAGLSEAFAAGQAMLREGVTLLAASRPTESAAERRGHGAFTRLLLDGLEGGAADHFGHVSALSLYNFASRAFDAWEQRPVFKSHVVTSSPLRICRAWIDPQLLRRLPSYFPAADARHSMSPAHEGLRPIPNGAEPTEEQQAFDYFKELRNAGLLTTDNNKDLYFVALGSKDVYLTPAGRYFWKLATEGKL